MFTSKRSSLLNKVKSAKTHFPSISVSNPVPIHPKPSEKNNTHSSPKEKNYIKTRSASFLTNTLNTAPITPQNTSSLNKNPKFKFDASSPLLSQITEKRNQKSKAKNSDQFILITKKSMSSSLSELKEIYESLGLTKKVFSLFEEFFKDLIAKDKKFGHLLTVIKEVYDEWISKSNQHNDEYISLKNESLSLKENLDKKTEEIKTLTKKVTILCKENYSLGQNIGNLQEDYDKLLAKMKYTCDVKSGSVPKNSDFQNKLVDDNLEYSKLLYQMNMKIKDFSNREKKYKLVLKKIEESGIKIESYFKILENDGSEEEFFSKDEGSRGFRDESFDKIEVSVCSEFSAGSCIPFTLNS